MPLFSRRRAGAALFTACAAAVVGGLAASAEGAASASETLFLDAHQSAAHDMSHAACESAGGCGPTVQASTVLDSGTTYTIKVVGAVSVWDGWQFRRCGKPEPTPEFGSTGLSARPANDDAQFRFAQTVTGNQTCPKLPKKSALFQINLGDSAGWFHPTAIDNPTKPSGDNNAANDQHPYTFSVVGDGVAPAFRFVDYHPSDNDGEFRIQILTK
jgi:hypothetical protein